MNQELNVSLELATVSPVALESTVAASASPMVLDQALLSQVGGGISPSGPHGTW